MITRRSAAKPKRRIQGRPSTLQIQNVSARVRLPTIIPSKRWLCSAAIAGFWVQPSGLSEPFESGQSGKIIPAPIVVVNPPA